ncbi:thiamine-phosphate pyrophosphorylase [Paenibacillus curdlanolyticus YK9]|uniref:Thiamine-phosphate synthase n=1 Tax=Paenibacillus curdlanolyticus YK9 TaxID=717606 RepID=E0I6A1_9BACL|nr:thiamine phosphate synthase [Paenibacillus curdlanolyticus]EFM11567.1 thiamine-phosphate pyrophosphorylase [Paenibacillus curdlanolyticus YK9]
MMTERQSRFHEGIRLYVITGANYHPGRTLADVMEQTLIGGADIIQLRDKTASQRELLEQARVLRELTKRYGVPLIINDYIDIALEVGADGVHLGQDDRSLAEARERLGQDAIIGISTHQLLHALTAQAGGADYIGVGPVYPTGTKPGKAAVTTNYVTEAAASVKIPFVAIGGITLDNVDTVLAAGATRVCAVSAVVGAPDPAAVCRSFKEWIAAADTARIAGRAFFAAEGSVIVSVNVNGKATRTAARSVLELVREHGLENRRMVVELDGEIVERAAWERTPIRDGAAVELVHFVGGG